MDKSNENLENIPNSNDCTIISINNSNDTSSVTEKLQKRTSMLKTAWGYVETAGMALGAIGSATLVVGGVFLGAKYLMGSGGNSRNSGNPGNSVGAFKSASPQVLNTGNQCGVPVDHFLEAGIGQCWQNENEQKFKENEQKFEDINDSIYNLTSDFENVSKLVSGFYNETEARFKAAEKSIGAYYNDTEYLKNEKDKLWDGINDTQEELVKFKKEFNSTKEELGREITELGTEIDGVRNATADGFAKVGKKIDTLSNTTSQTQEELVKFKKEFNSTKEELGREITELGTEIDGVRNATADEFAKVGKKIDTLSNTTSQTQEKLVKFEEEFNTAEDLLKGNISNLEKRVNSTKEELGREITELGTEIAGVRNATADGFAKVGKIDAAQTNLQNQFYGLNKTALEKIYEIEKILEPELENLVEDIRQGKFNITEISEKVKELLQENKELKKRVEVLEGKVGNYNSKEIGDVVNMITSAIAGENVTVIGETQSGQNGTVSASLELGQGDTAKNISIFPGEIKHISSKFSGIDSEIKQAIEAASVACGIGGALLFAIGAGIYIRNYVLDGRDGWIGKIFPRFFGLVIRSNISTGIEMDNSLSYKLYTTSNDFSSSYNFSNYSDFEDSSSFDSSQFGSSSSSDGSKSGSPSSSEDSKSGTPTPPDSSKSGSSSPSDDSESETLSSSDYSESETSSSSDYSKSGSSGPSDDSKAKTLNSPDGSGSGSSGSSGESPKPNNTIDLIEECFVEVAKEELIIGGFYDEVTGSIKDEKKEDAKKTMAGKFKRLLELDRHLEEIEIELRKAAGEYDDEKEPMKFRLQREGESSSSNEVHRPDNGSGSTPEKRCDSWAEYILSPIRAIWRGVSSYI